MAEATPQQNPPEVQPRDRPLLALGDQRVVTVDDVAFGGDGVARYGEFVVFVPFAARGETVEIEVVEVKRRFARARLVRVLVASADRVIPPCRYFGECGGCQYQHLAYPAQLAIKHAQVTELLRRIGRFSDVPIDAVLPSPRPYGYRNRVLVRSQWNGREQKLVIGFLGQNHRWVVDLEECLIAEPGLNEQLREVRLHPPRKGGLKVALRHLPEDWVVPPDSFFQNNFYLLPGLVGVVRQRLQSAGCRFLVDAYCGVGFFGIELADLVEAYAGIESDLPAVRAARENAARRDRRNGEFLLGSVETVLPEVLSRFPPSATALILDPPRRGCARASLEFLREQRPAQILYVSCHPATLARDLQVLTETGCYRLERVVPVDMFPQTQHVELVADLRLRPCQAALL